MRVRTEDKRQAILDVALEVFREFGYERASMATISRRVGGSKGTLYGYFKSKEELFETAMKAAIEGPGDQVMDLLHSTDADLQAVLTRFAKAYIGFVIGHEVLAITRTAIAEGYSSPLGPHLFSQGPERALSKLTEYFADLMKEKRLLAGDPHGAARHFKGLIEAGFLEEALYGARTAQISAVDAAVKIFLRGYQA